MASATEVATAGLLPLLMKVPCSPYDEIDGLPYFRRLCEKVRLHAAGDLREDLHENLGRGMDLWTCQFLGVTYDDLKAKVLEESTDEEALAWAREHGTTRPDHEQTWWVAFMKTVGFRDRLAQRLQERIAESGLTDRPGLLTMFDYIDADEGR